MMTDTSTVPALIGLGPGPCTGVRMLLDLPQQVVGRSPGCEIRLAEAQVAARHAVLTHRDGRTWVRDLGSPGGTFLNGQRLGGTAQPLRPGDVVVFGTVALRLTAETDQRPAVEPPAVERPDRGPASVRQHPHLDRRREALLREIERIRTRARRLIGCGAVAFVFGFVLFSAAVLGLLTAAGQDRASQPLGRDLIGVPSGLLGWGISAAGMLLLVAGFALYGAAGARRRRLERELPWPTSSRSAR